MQCRSINSPLTGAQALPQDLPHSHAGNDDTIQLPTYKMSVRIHDKARCPHVSILTLQGNTEQLSFVQTEAQSPQDLM